jgi:glycosyltransferase involved in cell wall biosynthesis
VSPRELSIGIDVRAALRGPCGIGRYSVELSRALLELPRPPRVLLYGASRRGCAGATRLPRELTANPRARLFAPRLPAKLVALLAGLPGFRTELLTGRLDLFHHTDLVFVKGFSCPEVVTVHDLAFEVSGEFHDPGFHASARRRLREAVARAAAVVVPSETTKADLVRLWGVEVAKVSVIPHGGDHLLRVARSSRRDARSDPSSGYLLHVGTLEPRKNLPRLVRAYRGARARGLKLDLVLVGAWGWRTEELREELSRCGTAAPVFVRGSVEDGELRAWIEDAAALVYPSLYEGFGLPVAEAFALGAPAITSARSATREVAGDAAALVDPESEEDLRRALLEAGGDPALRRELSERGRRRAALFTWAAAARATLALCERACA